ncbi:unnamed protein product [Bursaphelenchus okinawaensis]|uniref:THAP-type domain-containing protein n=1 Tax=Bursaphelenchus okinawaensis TaxID=465554 RepID=A0A811KSF2_9BILA|nr:unnamed protein product [Bursaphelenchus okinawaensis]CAG9111449.1 unnamed protein product [Bursaphelenchus okinawaensis]
MRRTPIITAHDLRHRGKRPVNVSYRPFFVSATCVVCPFPEFPLASFPKDEAIRRKWAAVLNLPIIPTSRATICSKHFPPNSFTDKERRKKDAHPISDFDRQKLMEQAELGIKEEVDANVDESEQKKKEEKELPKYYIENLKRFSSYKFCPMCGTSIQNLKIFIKGVAVTIKYECSPACNGIEQEQVSERRSRHLINVECVRSAIGASIGVGPITKFAKSLSLAWLSTTSFRSIMKQIKPSSTDASVEDDPEASVEEEPDALVEEALEEDSDEDILTEACIQPFQIKA